MTPGSGGATDATLIYQHATSEADRAIAEAVDTALTIEQAKTRREHPAMAQEWHDA